MDQTPRTKTGNSVVVTGIGVETAQDAWDLLTGNPVSPESIRVSHDCRPDHYLVRKKTRKFMSKQDRLALCAAAKAIESSEVKSDILSHRCGIFMTVGYIPFSLDEAVRLSRNSRDKNRFSMKLFSTSRLENSRTEKSPFPWKRPGSR